MTSRGFVFLLAVAVITSVTAGLIAERFTSPGLERTVWFGIMLTAVMYPAGIFAERRGWVRGNLDLSKRGKGDRAKDRNSAGDVK